MFGHLFGARIGHLFGHISDDFTTAYILHVFGFLRGAQRRARRRREAPPARPPTLLIPYSARFGSARPGGGSSQSNGDIARTIIELRKTPNERDLLGTILDPAWCCVGRTLA